MDRKLILYLTVVLIGKACCQTLDDVMILTPEGQKVYSSVGNVVVLECRVTNLPSTRKLNWVFVKHSQTIFHGDQLMVDSTRYSILHPPHSNKYELQIIGAKASDQGSYRCEVDGSKKTVAIELILAGAPDRPELNTTALNQTECCIEQGVSLTCQPVCHPSSLSDSFDVASACDSGDVLDLVHCGSDGRNHENCCAARNVPALCLTFCSNEARRMTEIGSEELQCLGYTTQIISCFEFGAVTLPGPPQQVSALPVTRGPGQYSLLVSWKPPVLNPANVTGYIISYKKSSDSKFRTTEAQSSSAKQFTVNGLLVNTQYSVYVTAVGHHGSSQSSSQIDVILEDTSQPGFATDVLSCCSQRRVTAECQTLLCHPRIWDTFNTTAMLACYHFLPDVFNCLAGQGNHTPCCMVNHVPDPCLDMCEGNPPSFDESVYQCVPKLSTIEACVELGLDTTPAPPTKVTLMSISTNQAVVSWEPPDQNGSSTILAYYVQLRRGNENARWVTVDRVVGTFIKLENLTETENYAVRVLTETAGESSLPSMTLRFTTYPVIETGTDRPVIAHNMTQCCVDTGMPTVCAVGCKYLQNITSYYEEHLSQCFPYIGNVLSCGTDGRDHTACCEERGVQEDCLQLCTYSQSAAIHPSLYKCISDTSLAILCFKEGLEDLVRKPDNVTAVNTTTQHVQIEWLAPNTGPRPEKYIIFYKNVFTGYNKTDYTMDKVYIVQNLLPSTVYEILVASFLNGSRSPFANVTVFTPAQDVPVTPGSPSNYSIGLWNNRTHCCESSGISTECQPVCLNRPADTNADCIKERHKILVCSADGKDHTFCCKQGGLPPECLSLCGSVTPDVLTVEMAGCLADASVDIITSCFLSNANLVPSPPLSFIVQNLGDRVKLWWKDSAVNCGSPQDCAYDVHYWLANNRSMYRTLRDLTSPYIMPLSAPDKQYTFTVTARNAYGSSAAAPWQTVRTVSSGPDVSVAQFPSLDIYNVGSYVTLQCDAFNFFEAPTITWTLFGRELGQGRKLHLGPVTKESEGNYTCTASSGDTKLSVNSYLNIRFQPKLVYFRTDTVSPNIGGQTILACWFRGHPFINTTTTAWTKDGQTIAVSSSKYSSTAKTRLHTGITPFKLKIANVVPSDYGLYKCSVSNQYGMASGTTRLTNPDGMPPEVTPAPNQQQNITGCCRRHKVKDPECMRLCSFEVDVQQAVADPGTYGVCLLYFSELVSCAADGADHTACCQQQGVHPFCWPFCAGNIPASNNVFDDPHLLQCVPETPTIFGCLARGYDRIPTAPAVVQATLVSDSIIVRWSLPKRNADRVGFYRVYYNSTGNQVPQTHFVTSSLLTHTIENVLSNHIYYVWVIAGNDNGESHPSTKVSVSVHGVFPMPPSDVIVTVFDGTNIEASWTAPPPESSRVDAYVVFYKRVNDVKFVMSRTRGTSIRIYDLEPEVDYELYVKSVNSQGDGLIASNKVKFTTGRPGYTAPHRASEITAAQISGIILAGVAVVAIGVVIFLLISRSRILKQQTTDSVAFENPSYGNQQVHIGGLSGETALENVMQPQTQPETDGSFGYSRLNEDQIAAAAAEAKSVPEMEYPSTDYGYDKPVGMKLEANGRSQEVATLDVSDITVQDKNESTS